MVEPAVVFLRLAQYLAASVLMGSALFFVYALPRRGPGSAANLHWTKPLLAMAAFVLALAALLGLIAQTAILAGSLSAALTLESLSAVVTQMDLGKAAVARSIIGLAGATYALAVPPGRALWLGAGVFGTLATVTLGWMGHGAASEAGGYLPHLAADILHALAAAMWIGALIGFAGLAFPRRQEPAALPAIARALERFSPIGIALVATLVLTGLANAWFLVGPGIGAALQDPYGQWLAFKLALFGGMLLLAALHRQRSVPALAARLQAGSMPLDDALGSLRRSLGMEALLGIAVLVTVAWLGTLAPPGLG